MYIYVEILIRDNILIFLLHILLLHVCTYTCVRIHMYINQK